MNVSGFDSKNSGFTDGSENSCDSVLEIERTLSDQTAALAANEVARSESPVLGDYEILRELGRGGMGVVYEAIQRSLGRRVALKILPGAGVVDKVAMQRFQLEAAAAARLQHPNIVSIIEVGAENDVHYYAMQFIDGRTLLGVTAEPMQAANWMLQLADALECAHRQGIVHRDIKPSNILLDQNGKVWITDFGIAKVDDGELTRTGDIPGSPRYMPPERFRGISDTRSDIYGLGISIYEVISGRPAYGPMERESLIARIEQTDPPTPRTLNPSVPRDLETIILKSIARVAETRYRTAAELAEDLRRFLKELPILARRTSQFELVLRWSRKNRVLAALTVVTPLLLMVVVSLAIVSGIIRDERDRAVDAETASKIRQSLFESVNHRTSLFAGEQQQAREILDRIEIARAEPALQSEIQKELIASRVRSDLKPGPTISDRPSPMVTSSSAAWIAEPRNNHEVLLRRTDEDAKQGKVIRHSVDGELLQFGSGDRYLAIYNIREFRKYGYRSPLPILQVYDSVESRLIFPTPKPFVAFDCHDGSQLIAVAVETAVVELWKADANGETLIGEIPIRHPCNNLKISPDGNIIAVVYSSLSDFVDLYEVSTGRRINSLSSRQPSCVAWSPDGSLLAVAAENQGLFPIEIWDPREQKRISQTKANEHQSRIHHLAFTLSNNHLISVSFDNTTRLWSTWSGNCQSIQPGSCAVPASISNLNHAGVMTTHAGTQWISIQSGCGIDLPFDTHHQTEQPWQVALHPGNRLLAAGTSSDIQFYDVITQRHLGAIPVNSLMEFVAFSSDGEEFVVSSASGVVVWKIHQSESDREIRMTFEFLRSSPIELTGARMSGESCFFVANKVPYEISEYDFRTGRVRRTFGRHEGPPVFLPGVTSDVVVTLSGNSQAVLQAWNPKTGNLICAHPVTSDIGNLVFIPQRNEFAVLARAAVEFRDLMSWKLKGTVTKNAELSVVEQGLISSSDGKFLVTRLSPSEISFIDTASREVRMRLTVPEGENSFGMALSTDRRILIDSYPVEFRLRMFQLGDLRSELIRAGFDDPLSMDESKSVGTGNSASPRADQKSLNITIVPRNNGVTPDAIDGPSLTLPNDDSPGARADGSNPEVFSSDQNLQSVLTESWQQLLRSGAETDYKRRILKLEQVIQVHPDDTRLKNVYGMALYRAGRFEEARQILTANISESPVEEVGYDLVVLALVAAKSGKYHESRATLEIVGRMRNFYPAPSDRKTQRMEHLIRECKSILPPSKD